MHDGLIGRNVAALVKPPRLPKPKLQVFSQEEALRFLEIVKSHWFEAIFTVALALGMREGENPRVAMARREPRHRQT